MNSGQACRPCRGSCSLIPGRGCFGDLPGDEIVVSPPSPIIEPLTCALLYSTPKAPLPPKSTSNELDNKIGTKTLERYTVKLPQTRTHPSIKPQLPQLGLDKLWGAVPYNRKRLPRALPLVESNLAHLDVKTLSFFGLRNIDDPGHLKLALCVKVC